MQNQQRAQTKAGGVRSRCPLTRRNQTNKQTKRHLYGQSCGVDRAPFFPKRMIKGVGVFSTSRRRILDQTQGTNEAQDQQSNSKQKLRLDAESLLSNDMFPPYLQYASPVQAFLKQDRSQTGLKAIHKMLANTSGTNTLNMKSERAEKRSPIKARCKNWVCVCCFLNCSHELRNEN